MIPLDAAAAEARLADLKARCADCKGPAADRDGVTFWRRQTPSSHRLDALCRDCAGVRDAARAKR